MTFARISTGTGLALLAAAIVLHAAVTAGTGRVEPAADASWTPVFTPMPATQAPAAVAPSGGSVALTRAEFNALPHAARNDFFRRGGRISD